jgi:CDP-glucose 4,6-dehydratase
LENMAIDAQFWQGKRVLLTGHTGFKGGWLSLWLQSLGAEVTGFSLAPPTNPNLYEIAAVGQDMSHIHGDIRDLALLTQHVNQTQADIVIHMAAQSLVRLSYETPVETYATNVMGTVNVLEAVRRSQSVKAAIIVTSDKCYENREQIWGYRENEAMGGFDPYSNSKGCAELVTASYRASFMHPENYKSHGKAIATVRAGNVIGGGDWAQDRLIPDILNALSTNKPVILRNPNAIRPWQHVLEPLGGYLQLAQKLYQEGADYAQAWNFGPNDHDAKSVEWMTAQLIKSWGNNASYQTQVSEANKHEAQLLTLDCTKARTKLDWHPKWHAEIAINRICKWHQAYLKGDDMRAYCLNEISEYQTLTA